MAEVLEIVDQRLADAIVGSVVSRLDKGAAFLRVPEVVSPLPVGLIIDGVSARHAVRFAVFTNEVPTVSESTVLTTDVATAIDWRNDGGVGEALVVIGDLERDRASGLAELPTFRADEVRTALFERLISECAPMNPPAPLLTLLRALGGLEGLTDLRACADYCSSLLPPDAGLVDRARKQLWRLSLLADTQTHVFDQKVLRRNAETVGRLLSLDATSLQRLMQHIDDLGPDRYEALRRFAKSGNTSELEGLEFTRVSTALRAVASDKGPNGALKLGLDDDAPHITISKLVDSEEVDEEDFLAQVRKLPESSSADRSVSVGTEKLDWKIANLDPIADLFEDASGDFTYSGSAGSIERVPDDEAFSTPGTGSVEWGALGEIADSLDVLAKRAGVATTTGDLLREILEARHLLSAYVPSISDEGVRLFIGAPSLRKTAGRLVSAWVELWQSLEDLRGALQEADRRYAVELAERLSSTDLRIVIHKGDVTAHVLPLHPIVIEPRVRAAELLASNPDVPADFFDLIVESLDPALPSLMVRNQGSSVALGYAGTRNGLLHYAREPHQIDAADVPRAIIQIIGRFISVHPYAELSLSLCLVSPPPKVARALLRWLGEAQIQRSRLDILAAPDLVDETRNALDEAMEEMVSGEIADAASRFAYSVERLERLSDVPVAIEKSEGPPHVLLFFDLAEVEQSGLGAAANSPEVGSLVSEWEFSTNPLEGSRPVIRPRSGSSELADLVNAQAGLFGSTVPLQERSPLLSPTAEALLVDLADSATWIGTCEGMAAFVPSPRIGELDLLGRIGGTSHVTFLYSQHAGLLLEPILRYLQRHAWLLPDQGALAEFLLGTVRRAVPEGLLGFFKATGNLSDAAVLGRLGFAAVLAYLEDERPGRLVVSLDTEGARRWLGLRDGPEIRADLLAIDLDSESASIEAIEIKSRTEDLQWGKQPPEWLSKALDQVQEIHRLLAQMFDVSEPDALTPSRREILKRQVFLEALQQWESLRNEDAPSYERRIENLNALFDRKTPVTLSRRVFAVSAKSSSDVETREIGEPVTTVTSLGVEWFKQALAQQPGADVEIPLAMLDEFADIFDDLDGSSDDDAPSATSTAEPGSAGGPADDSEQADAAVAAAEEPLQEIAYQPEAEPELETEPVPVPVPYKASPVIAQLARALRDALIARKVQFTAIEDDAIVVGPSVVQIPFSVQAGVRLSTLEVQESDLARDLGVQSVRISNWAGRPGYAVAQLPRADRAFPDVTQLVRPAESTYPTLALGATLEFRPYWFGLDSLPHLLVGGTSGSGKSVFLRSLLWQLTKLYEPSELDLVIIDAKGMSDYLDFAKAGQIKAAADFHLGVYGALDVFSEIVEKRLPARMQAFRDYAGAALDSDSPVHLTNLREVLAYAEETGQQTALRPLVVVIDEFAELMLASTDRKKFETLVTRFNQIARAVGGHLIAATQRPSTEVVTGLMKSNFARVALRTQGKVDSRVILDENGAETLLGKGDLLFRSPDSGTVRLQGYSAIGPFRFP